jgi:hypothetical protein
MREISASLDMHTTIALFDSKNFRSHCLLRDLVAVFGNVRFFIVLDNYIDDIAQRGIRR